MIKKATNVQYSYTISGNGIQNGNPSPSNILPFDGCGDKTDNLFDKSHVVIGERVLQSSVTTDAEYAHTDYINIEGYTYITVNKTHPANTTNIYFYAEKTNQSIGYYKGTTAEIPTGAKYVRANLAPEDIDTFMLNPGTEALPYKPYGYVLPIEYDNNISAPIYLGQVQTTRNIKKLVLTGQETIAGSAVTGGWIITNLSDSINNTSGMQTAYCSHYLAKVNSALSELSNGEMCISTQYNNRINFVTTFQTSTEFGNYLSQQYAAGTPVTVWYVLSTPETAVVNEPLMKIGSYVDTINNTQSGIDISTNNLVVNTIIPPSKIDITSTATWVPINYNKNGTEIISTIAPIDFLSNGQNITVGLKGNTEQLEIPSPSNIVMPQGTGERTGNLLAWDKNLIGTASLGVITNNSVISTTIDVRNVSSLYFTGDVSLMNSGVYRIGKANNPITVGSNILTSYFTDFTGGVLDVSDCNYVLVSASTFGGPSENVDLIKSTYICNTGSTPLPYEPYGYKIPILSANITTPIYLGEVETTRKIKKLVFTGNENIGAYDSTYNRFSIIIPDSLIIGVRLSPVICSHYQAISDGRGIANVPNNAIYSDSSTSRWFIKTTEYTNDTDFKSYLAAQYAAGTPVTVWYVLATPETGIINEPLMKIGNYADEVSNITIPTTKGSNTLSINTSVQPSNVQLSISGWVPHNNIKEYKNNAWMATSWEGFRDIVRAGNGPTRYPIGTKLYETWGDNTSNAWIVVDYDNSNYNDPDISALGYTHNVVLYEEKINYLKVFDNAEAWLYTESVLPAGTYRFTIPNYDATYGGNKTYIFTSTVDVPIHGQLTLSWPYQQNPASVSAYITNTSTTALFTATVSEWDGTTTSEDLGTIKLAMTDPDSTYGKLNHIHRARYGSNNYYQSGIRQWMNADATANNWWKPTNIFDRPYSNRNTDGGLYLINNDFKQVIAAPNITCITNNTFETGAYRGTPFALQTNYTVRDKIFLPTHTELNLSSSPNIGTIFSQYTNTGNDDRIKYRNGNAYYYWFRTSYPSYGSPVRRVNLSGALSNNSASNTYGAVRACIIQ